MKLEYSVEMLSDWHVGSGLDSGPAADAVVLKDDDGLPYIPGKTMKGLIRDALADILSVSGNLVNEKVVIKIFGVEATSKKNYSQPGTAFFSDVTIPSQEKQEVIKNSLSSFLFRRISSTKINKNGVAEPKSLRTMEVTIPLKLTGFILIDDNTAEEEIKVLQMAFKWVRSLGMNRNRGLGRCKISVLN